MVGQLLWVVRALTGFLSQSRYPTPLNLTGFASSLDTGASIYYPGSAEFANASTRWSAAHTPQYDMIVEVVTETDVQKTVRSFSTIRPGC